MRRARTTAIIIASVYSLNFDFVTVLFAANVNTPYIEMLEIVLSLNFYFTLSTAKKAS